MKMNFDLQHWNHGRNTEQRTENQIQWIVESQPWTELLKFQ